MRSVWRYQASEMLVAVPEGQVAPSEQVMDQTWSLAPSETEVQRLVSTVGVRGFGKALGVVEWRGCEAQNP